MASFELDMFNIVLNWVKSAYCDYKTSISITYNLIMISDIHVSLRVNRMLLVYVKGNLISELQYSSPNLFADISEIIEKVQKTNV